MFAVGEDAYFGCMLYEGTVELLPRASCQGDGDNISFAFLYGFDGNTKYGYSWQTEYVATQGVIWALVQGYFRDIRSAKASR